MDTAWYNNSAMMGLLGVFLGAILSFFGTMYSEYAKVKALEKEQELKEREKSKEKQELAHQHYLTLINENRAVIYAGMINYKEYMSSEERTELVRRLPSVLAELDLYSTKEICTKCGNLSGNLLNAVFDGEKFQKDYDDIVELMKNANQQGTTQNRRRLKLL